MLSPPPDARATTWASGAERAPFGEISSGTELPPCSKSCFTLGSVFASRNGSLLPSGEGKLDGRDPEGQLAAGRGRRLWGHRHAVGEARGRGRSGVRQVKMEDRSRCGAVASAHEYFKSFWSDTSQEHRSRWRCARACTTYFSSMWDQRRGKNYTGI